MSLLSSSSAKRPWQSSRVEVEKIAPNQNGSKLRGRAKLDEESLAFDERSHLAYGLIADQISAPVLSAPTDLLREQIRWSTAPTVLGQTEPAEPPNRTPDPAAPSDLVLLLGTNRMRPGLCMQLTRTLLYVLCAAAICRCLSRHWSLTFCTLNSFKLCTVRHSSIPVLFITFVGVFVLIFVCKTA